MDLLLITAELDATGKPLATRSTACPAGSVVVGSAAGAAVPLPNLTAGSFALEADAHSEVVLSRCDPALAVRRDGQPLAVGAAIRNGDRLQVPGYELQVVFSFARARQGRAAGVMPLLMAALVALVMITEVAVAIWLPREVARRHFWGEELARQQLLARVDVLRTNLFTFGRRNRHPYLLQTAVLARAEVDKMAQYLRQRQERLSAGQLRDVSQDLSAYERLYDRLRDGSQFPPESQLDLDPPLRALLKEKAAP